METTYSVMTKYEDIDAVGTSMPRNSKWCPFALEAPERVQTALAASLGARHLLTIREPENICCHSALL